MPKIDTREYQRIRMAEKKRRQKKAKPRERKTPSERLSFEQYWMLLTRRKPELKAWLKEIIWADFKARGLSDSELLSTYDDALEKFGIK